VTGWIALHRGWRDCDVFADGEPMSEREAWLWLIEKAAWKQCHRRNAKGERITIERGQIHVSLRALETAFGWGKNKVARYIERLQDHEMIGTVSGQSGTVITICNYDRYQVDRDSLEPETGTAKGQTRDTHKEGKQGKKEEGKARKSAPRQTDFEIPDWVPAEPIAAFAEMRRRKGKPMDAYTAKQLFGRLRSIADAGWNLEDVIAKATIHQHDGFWMPDGRDSNVRRANPAASAEQWTEERKAAYLARLNTDAPARPPPGPVGDMIGRIGSGLRVGGTHA
jgi:hypothetical protein